jgi:CheY-like chemotaxis protein
VNSARRVLVIEDNPDCAQSLTILLREMGHEAEFVLSGRDALRKARQIRPEVIFLDIGLPDIDGYAIARQLRCEPGLEGTRILAVTAYGQDEDRLRSRDAGCDQHFVKPLDPALLESLLGPRAV